MSCSTAYCLLRILRLRSRVIFHISSPLKEVAQLFSLPEHEAPELHKADLVHLQAGVGLHAPAQVRAAPGRKAVALSCVPEEAEQLAHHYEYNAPVLRVLERRRPRLPAIRRW